MWQLSQCAHGRKLRGNAMVHGTVVLHADWCWHAALHNIKLLSSCPLPSISENWVKDGVWSVSGCVWVCLDDVWVCLDDVWVSLANVFGV